MDHPTRVQKLTEINAAVDRIIAQRDGARSEAEESFVEIDDHIQQLHDKVMQASPEEAAVD